MLALVHNRAGPEVQNESNLNHTRQDTEWNWLKSRGKNRKQTDA